MEQNCRDCHNPFTLTERDKKYFMERGLTLPKRCPACRQAKRTRERVDLRNCVGKMICRTQTSVIGDNSYLGESNKVKLLAVQEDGSLVIENHWFHLDKNIEVDFTLSPEFNDGYWKVVEGVLT